MNIKEINIANVYWEKISSDYNKIAYNLEKLECIIEAAFAEAYTGNGVFDEDAVNILTKNLTQFDVGRETIERYFNTCNDDEDFIYTLKLIVRAKINAALGDCVIKLDNNE